MGRTRFNIELNKISKHINYKYGLAKENDQRVVYIMGRGWVTPKIIDNNCKKRIDRIHKRFDRLVTKYLANDELFNRNCIREFNIPVDKFEENKKKFMQFECYFKQVKNLSMEDLKEDVEQGIRRLTRELENVISDNEFKVTKTKF